MKKLYMLCVICLLIVSSCSSDDAEIKVSEDIVGTWIGTDMSLFEDIETTIEGQTIESSITGEGYDLTNELTFTKSPNLVTSEGSINMKLSYTVNGITHIEEVEGFEFFDDGIWELEGNDLIITGPNEEIVEDDEEELRKVTVFKLTGNALIIKISETDEHMQDGKTITTTIEVLASFIRA